MGSEAEFDRRRHVRCFPIKRWRLGTDVSWDGECASEATTWKEHRSAWWVDGLEDASHKKA